LLNPAGFQPEDVESALTNGNLIPNYLTTDGEYYALQGRDDYFDIRHCRGQNLEPLLARAWNFGRLLATVPFVEMVAISGSLAAQNADSDADIDFFVIAKAGHLWRVRLLVRIIRHIDWKFGTRSFCPNSMRSTRSIEFALERPYIAQELRQMQPIFGHDVYRDVMKANAWSQHFLPNASEAPPSASLCQPYSQPLRSLLEILLGRPFGEYLEKWWSTRKIAQFERPDHALYAYTPFTLEQEGLNLAVADKIEEAYSQRLRSVGISLKQVTNFSESNRQTKLIAER
jgi:hypothetical protein